MQMLYKTCGPVIDKIQPEQVMAYMTSHGWQEPNKKEKGVHVFIRPDYPGVEIRTPRDQTQDGYGLRLSLAIIGVAIVENRLAFNVLNEIIGVDPSTHAGPATRALFDEIARTFLDARNSDGGIEGFFEENSLIVDLTNEIVDNLIAEWQPEQPNKNDPATPEE